MSRHSLQLRLGLAAGLLITLALALAGAGLTLLFDRQMERRAGAELRLTLKSLAAQLRVDAQGTLHLDGELVEPRFSQPYSGLYWQISADNGALLRSRSLWDEALDDKPSALAPYPATSSLPGPENSRVLVLSRTVVIGGADAEREARITVGMDHADLRLERRSFLNLLIPSLLALCLLLTLAMAGFLRLALHPFRVLRASLNAVHSGRARRLDRAVPDEVRPVVDDLNRLLAFQDAAIERAQTQAGDLAHGLKTPLTILGAMARQAQTQGQQALGQDLQEQIASMQRHVERVLARARAGLTAAVGKQSTNVAEVVNKTLSAIQTLPDAQKLDWETEIHPDLHFSGDTGDLTELLGNIMDNARKWARYRVRISTEIAGEDDFILIIEDDGPGLPADEALRIERGRRWDESRPGTGFGLAIARDLVEAYRGNIGFSKSAQLGGLSVAMTLPQTQGHTN